MRNKCVINHVLLRNETYYFLKRVPYDLKELVKKLSERITNAETRKRSRTAEEYQRFLYAIELYSNRHMEVIFHTS